MYAIKHGNDFYGHTQNHFLHADVTGILMCMQMIRSFHYRNYKLHRWERWKTPFM